MYPPSTCTERERERVVRDRVREYCVEKEYEEVAKLLEDDANTKIVDQMLQDYDCMAYLSVVIYGVHSAGLASRPVDKVFCHAHGLMLDEEYLQNFDLKVKHPELPCVISRCPNAKTYCFPMEIIDTMMYG
ncbi:hypothetical protein AAVH_19796 [Aphelenchoides avenae]|nr:hypothetical protein AAVH_19796 [Aphelenchus avenae]